MKNLYICLGLTLTVLSCSPVNNDETTLNPSNPQSQSVGPFQIDFTGNSKSYTHQLDIPIQQNEGVLDYQFSSALRHSFILKEAQATLSGCQSNPTTQIFWLPDLKDKSQISILSINQRFSNFPNSNGQLVVSFKNIEGCSRLQLSIHIEKVDPLPRLGQNCDSQISSCQVIASCKEKDATTYFYESEVWNQNGAYYLKKYLNRGDGTRSLQTSVSASFNLTNKKIYFSSNITQNTSLIIDRISSESTFSDNINGQTYTQSMICDFL